MADVGKVVSIQGKIVEAIDDAIDRAESAVGEVRNRSYSADKLISDIARNWIDACDVWKFAINQFGNSTGALQMTMKLADRSAVGVFDLPRGQQVTPKPTDLTTSQRTTIAANNVTVRVTSDKKQAIVDITIPQNVQLQPGTYSGTVCHDNGTQSPPAVFRVVCTVEP